MATARLSQRRVDSLKPRNSAYDIRDQELKGFGVRVLPSGAKRWFASLHNTPVSADRSAPILSVIMRQAEVYSYRPEGTNPCTGIRRHRLFEMELLSRGQTVPAR